MPGTTVSMDTDGDVEVVQEVIVLNDSDFSKMFDQTEARMKHVRLQDHDYTAAAEPSSKHYGETSQQRISAVSF